MLGVILAAGTGKRLQPYTNYIPKPLVEINKKPIIDYQIDALKAMGIKDIFVVSGFLRDKIEEHLGNNAYIVHNNNYESTNSMYSLFLLRSYLVGKEFLLLNADIVFYAEVIQELFKFPGSCSLVSKSRTKCDGEMNVIIKNDLITSFSKEIMAAEATATSLQITKINNADSVLLFNKIDDIINKQKRFKEFPARAYSTLIERRRFYPVYYEGVYCAEVDTVEDYNNANKLFSVKHTNH